VHARRLIFGFNAHDEALAWRALFCMDIAVQEHAPEPSASHYALLAAPPE
jgi:hypothetical protein